MKGLVIIGGGAAGLMAAVSAGREGLGNITVIEKNPRPARKMMITGKGRCNLTNNCETDTLVKNTLRGGRFMYSAFSGFSSRDTIAFFEELGVSLKTERGNRVFPTSDKAVTVVDALCAEARKYADIVNDTVTAVKKEQNGWSVVCKSGKNHACAAVIIATGGCYYSLTGSTGDGYRFADSLGHTVIRPTPSLIGLTCREGFCESLSGLTLKNVSLYLFEEGWKKPIYKDTGEMLFTHNGVSGPLVLTASAYLERGKSYKLVIDLKPGLDENALNRRILRDFEGVKNRDFNNALSKLLPSSLIPVIVAFSGIDPEKKVNQITAAERMGLVRLLKGFTLCVTGTEDPDRAVITRGGVSLKEINSSTMESKLAKGIFFAGEVLDADALTGGFNLQIAFSSGYQAGRAAAKTIKGE